MVAMSSVGGLLALLEEDNTKLQASALNALLARADGYWNEISDYLKCIEVLYESTNFPERKKAALLLSKVYYHLKEYSEAFVFAMAAGTMFDVSARDEYTHAIVKKCVDRYIELRENGEEEAKKDSQYGQLDTLFTTLMKNWFAADSEYNRLPEHIGLCISSQRLDLLEELATDYVKNMHSAEVLSCVLRLSTQHVVNVDFREKLLRTVVRLYASGPEKLRALNLIEMQQCLIFLNDHKEVVRNLCMLLDDEKAKQADLIAYQLAFDLFDHCNQDFLLAVAAGIREHLKEVSKSPTPDNYTKLFTILTGAPTTELQFQFLYSQNSLSIDVMNNLKKSIVHKKNSSITHSAIVMANSLMYCGTTCDQFLRENLDWLAQANNWARFTATATLGVINKGHVSQSMQVLQSYLPSAPGASGVTPYQEGGALFGLGLIHAPVGCNLREETAELVVPGATGETDDKVTRPREVLNFLIQCVQANQQSEQLIHGACLGIGLVSMSSKDEAIYDLLKEVMFNDNAVGGEAAAVAIGLLYLGSGDERAVEELLSYGKDTQHEKIIRGVSMSLAMLMYGREGHADTLIEDMLLSSDPWIRLGGVQVIGSAYAGTGNRKAIERLLTVCVQDTSDDVRRAGLLEIGFVTFKEPQLCLNVISGFADSHNPNIRWGVASALGIACAGTGNKQAVDMLWVLKDDTTDFVRQGAIVALAMVLMQKTSKELPRVKEFREDLEKHISDKYEDILTQFGCIIAMGIMEAGGRNQTIALHKNGHNLVKPIIGLRMFLQFWYWYPYILMLSLALQVCISSF